MFGGGIFVKGGENRTRGLKPASVFFEIMSKSYRVRVLSWREKFKYCQGVD